MLPENRLADRLDALLSARLAGVSPRPRETAEDAPLAPLLESAAALDTLAEAQPRAEFSAALERRLLARAVSLRAHHEPAETRTPAADAGGDRAGAAAPVHGVWPPASRVRRGGARRWWRIRPLQAVAAAVLIAVGMGSLLTAGVMAAPGNPLFALHRWEQGVRVGLEESAAGRVRLHLQYLSDALGVLDAAVSRRADDGAYRDALVMVGDEDAAAGRDLSTLPAGSERDGLATQLATLRAREQASLRAALASPLNWSDRLLTTSSLGALGVPVPVITGATVEPAGADDEGQWRIVLGGAGFQPGAVGVVDGRPAGIVQAVAPGQVTIIWSGAGRTFPRDALGIQNPDGTAAAAPALLRPDDGQNAGTPDKQVTPTHGGDHSGAHGSGKEPTPSVTPGPKPTPGDQASPTPPGGGEHH